MKRIAAEGMITGAIGATVVAAWFLMYDTAHGQPFRTPARLGAVLFQGLRDLGSLRITTTLVLEYSLVHWAAFMLFGWTGAALLAAADRDPRLLAGLFVLFCCFEVVALALIAVLGEWLFEALSQWSIVVGNLVAAQAMLGVFLHRHRVAWHEFLSAVESPPIVAPAGAPARARHRYALMLALFLASVGMPGPVGGGRQSAVQNNKA